MENNIIKYDVNWSDNTLIITIIVTIVIIFALYKTLKEKSTTGTIITGLVILGHIFCLSQMPVNIKIENNKFLLNKLIGRLEIDINDIVDSGMLTGDMGVRFGSGGSFGFLGYFKNEKLGEYTAYVRDTDNKFYIKLRDNKTYVFSCENPQKLLQNIQIFKNKIGLSK